MLSVVESGDGATLRFGDVDIALEQAVYKEYERARKGDGILSRQRLSERLGPQPAKEVFELLLRYGAAAPLLF